MKRIIFLALAVLLIGSAAYGHQLSSDPSGTMTSQFPAVYIDVYNEDDSETTMDAGDVVIWNLEDSSGDNDAMVQHTTTADTGIVAGVIWPNAIAYGTSGSMVIYGMAECDVESGSGVVERGILCASGTAGAGVGCASSAGAGSYAIATVAIASGQGKCFVNVN